MAQGQVVESGITTRQKVIAGAFVVIVGIIIWQVMGLFGGGGGGSTVPPAPVNVAGKPGAPGQPPMETPKPAEIAKPIAMTEREQQLMLLQQDTEARYLAAINELQMLKIEKDIAETNKAIASAKFDTVTAQKNVVNLLTTPDVPQAAYSGSLVSPTSSSGAPSASAPPTVSTEVTYSVVSITQLQSKWNAVIGARGVLYQVGIGDILPPDSAKVISIDKSGVVLEKDGVRKKVSLVPLI